MRSSGFRKIALGGLGAWFLLTAGCSFLTAPFVSERSFEFNYPESPEVDHVDTLHGKQVADPYRWLEEIDSPETAEWIEGQNDLTYEYLNSLPVREKIRKRLADLWNYDKYGTPFKRDDRYFYSIKKGLENHSVYYWADSLEDEPKVLIDPNTLSEDGTVALSGMSISEDGQWLAYAVSDAGSDWKTWRVRNVETGEDREDLIRWSKFSGAAWTHDNQGFYYSRYDAPEEGEELKAVNRFQKLYYHRLGDPQEKDRLVYHRPDQERWGFGASVTDDGRFLLIYVSDGTKEENALFYRDLSNPESEIVEWLTEFDASYSVVGNKGDTFYIHTDKDAPFSRLMAAKVGDGGSADWKEIVPEGDDALRRVNHLSNRFVLMYLRDAKSMVRIVEEDGAEVRQVDLPGLGSVGGFGGRPEETETFYSYTDFMTPTRVYRYDMVKDESVLLHAPEVDFDPSDFTARQVFYESKDGTKVPMFIVHRKDLRPDGAAPTYLYAYGGFNAALTPYFSVSNLVWMEMGGVFAQANLRGGGEYGESWHEAGMFEKKQNVFDDFIAAAEWLIDNGVTRRDKLSIGGGSNGGLLVGACMTQRPDLYGACVPAVGVMDMLRFHKFTIGWAWTSEYGSPDDPEMFPVLKAYSPYHNIRDGEKYPATLVLTGDHDDRVFPAHSFKYAARLQNAQAGEAPILIRIETRAGHGAGKPTAMIIESLTDKWAFLADQLDMKVSEFGG